MSFLKKMFSTQNNSQFIEEFLKELFQVSGFSLFCDVAESESEESSLKIDLYGGDEERLTHHHGKLLRALQIYISAVVRNRMKEQNPESRVHVYVDSQGFLERYEKDLLDFANKLKRKAIKEKRPILLKRPLDAFYRRKIHQQLTKDGKVETKSIGEGVLKTIKISPLQKTTTGNVL